MVSEEALVDAEEEAAGAAGDVGEAEAGDGLRRASGDELADGVLDEVADDVIRGVVDAAGFADLGLLLDGGALGGGADDVAQEALVDAAEDVDGDGGEIVGAVAVAEGLADVGEGGGVGSEVGAVEERVALEDDAVVDAVEAGASGAEVGPGRPLGAKVAEDVVGLDKAVFEEADEDEAVEGALGDLGEGGAVEGVVGLLEGLG